MGFDAINNLMMRHFKLLPSSIESRTRTYTQSHTSTFISPVSTSYISARAAGCCCSRRQNKSPKNKNFYFYFYFQLLLLTCVASVRDGYVKRAKRPLDGVTNSFAYNIRIRWPQSPTFFSYYLF